MRNINLVFCFFSLMYEVNCVLFDIQLNTSELVWKQLEALEHVHTFLVGVQQEIKESRDLLKQINNDFHLKQSTDAPLKAPTKRTYQGYLQGDLLRYMKPTASEGVLRTYSKPVTASTAAAVKKPEKQPTNAMYFQMAHDLGFPDYAPYYKDIFAPEFHRQGVETETTEDQQILFKDLNENATLPTTRTSSTERSTVKDMKTSVDREMLMQMYYTTTTTVSMAGDILNGKVLQQTTTEEVHPELHKQIERDATGYFSVGVENLFMLVAIKEPQDVQAVLEPSHIVVQKLEMSNRSNLLWMEYPMLDVLHQVSELLAPGVMGITEIQTKANLFWTMMKSRRSMLSDNVNQLLDFADGLVKEQEGEIIFDRLDDFYNFPNMTTSFMKPHYETGEELCEALIRAFEAPFYPETADRRLLVRAANDALRDHFGTSFKGRRNVGLRPKGDFWIRTPNKYTDKRFKFSPLPRGLRTVRSRFIFQKRSMTQPKAVTKQYLRSRTTYPQVYNRARTAKRQKNKYQQDFSKTQSNRNRTFSNMYRSKGRISARFKYNEKRLSTNAIISRNIFSEKIERKIQKRINVMTMRQKSKLQNTKWITGCIKPQAEEYPHFRGRSTEFRKVNVTKKNTSFEEYPKYVTNKYLNTKSALTKTKPELKNIKTINKDTTEIHTEYLITMNDDNSRASSMNHSDEVILDVSLLNRLLNVSAEESLDSIKSLNVSIETDNDIDVLNRLKEVFYEK